MTAPRKPKYGYGKCPTCGQLMLLVHGVSMQPKKAEIFQLIEQVSQRGGNDGTSRIQIETLASVFYSGIPRKRAHQTVRQQIAQINDLLEETDFRVNCIKGEGYRVEKVR